MDLKEKASKLEVKYFVLAFSTLNTDSRTCLVPATEIESVQKNGCIFTPAYYFKVNAAEAGWQLFPVPETFIQIPWRPQFAWIQCELHHNGKPSPQCPRRALKKQIEKAEKLGYVLKAGFELEFLLLNKDGTDFADKRDTPMELCLHDGFSILRNSNLLCKIHDAMESLGWRPYCIFHEGSMCQYEINFGYEDALTTADRYFFMKFMIKELAELEGYRASFMPVPLDSIFTCANGLHVNLSLWSGEKNINLLPGESDEKLGISSLAHHFIGGLLEHVQVSCAVLCPTVNSYKRISNESWSPGSVNWGGNNKTVLLRVPTNDRFEYRLPDGSTNLYLTLALLLAAGLDGVEKKTAPGPRTDEEVNNNKNQFKLIPRNLYEALNVLETSKFVRDCLGDELVEAFVFLKRKEWDQYSAVLTQWEKNFYLNC